MNCIDCNKEILRCKDCDTKFWKTELSNKVIELFRDVDYVKEIRYQDGNYECESHCFLILQNSNNNESEKHGDEIYDIFDKLFRDHPDLDIDYFCFNENNIGNFTEGELVIKYE